MPGLRRKRHFSGITFSALWSVPRLSWQIVFFLAEHRKKYSKNSVGVRIEEELVKENLVRFFHLRAEPLAPLLYEQGRADIEQGLELPPRGAGRGCMRGQQRKQC